MMRAELPDECADPESCPWLLIQAQTAQVSSASPAAQP